MVKPRALILGFLAALLLLTGAAVGWLALNQDRFTGALIEHLEAHLLTDAHIDHIDLDIWSHFPNVSIVLHDAWLLGSHSSADTLLKAEELSIACNALQLVSGNYDLTALDLSNASLSIASNSTGWNTQVWDAGGENSKGERFAIEQLVLLDVRVAVDAEEVAVDEATLQLNWTETGVMANGAGSCASIRATDFATTNPLTWSAELDWNTVEDTLNVRVSSLEWMGLAAELRVTRNESWAVEGTVKSAKLEALREVVELPAEFAVLNSKAEANGTFAWDGHTFRSKWTLPPARWEVPFSEEVIRVQGDARLWVKYEGGAWRADAPHVALRMNGVDWSGKVERILFATGSFEATGQGTVEWPDADLQALFPGEWPASGTFAWDGMVKRKRSGAMDWDGSWTLTGCAGTVNKTPWKADGRGRLNGVDLTVEAFEGHWDGIAMQGNVQGELPLVNPLRSSWTGSLTLPEFVFTSSDSGSVNLTALQLPAGMRAACDVDIGSLRYDGWELVNATFALEGDENGWHVPHFRAETLDGFISGDGALTLEIGARRGKILLHPTVVSCNLPKLFEAFDNFDQTTLRAEHLTGTFDASGSVQFSVDEAFSWQPESLDVLGSAAIHSGELSNLEAFQEIADYLRSNRLIAPLVDPGDLADRLEHVQFEHVESPVYISGGTVQLPHTKIRSSAMDITLEGQYRFDSSIDYTLGFSLRDLRAADESEFGTITDDGLGHQFFISMTGTVENPEYGWDREAQKNHRKENFQREKDLLKDLFRKSTP